MHPSQARLLLVLTTVLLALTAAQVLWDASADADPEATAAVWTLEAEAVERIEIDRADDRLVLQRAGETWRVEAPFEAEADPDKVEELLDALEGVRRGVPVSADDPEDFGLGADPVARVTAVVEGGERRELVVGHPAPVDHRTYVRGADGGVVAVSGQPGHLLTEPAAWFRDHRVLHFRPEAVRRVTLEGPEGALSVRGAGTRWWVEGFTRADADAVDDLILGLLDLRFDTFDAPDEAPEAPGRRAVVELDDGRQVEIRVGEGDEVGTPVWTSDGRRGRALTAALALLGQGPTDLGDHRAFPLEPHRSDAVVVIRGERRWEAVREGHDWSADARAPVERLAAASIHYRSEPAPPLTETYATVEVREGDAVWTIAVGQVVENSWRVARDLGGGEPYLVPLDDLEVLEALPTAH